MANLLQTMIFPMKFYNRLAILYFGALLVWLLFLLGSCATPQRKLERLLNKYPELKDSTTVIIDDSVKIDSPELDFSASLPFLNFRDTVIFVYVDTNDTSTPPITVSLKKTDNGDSLDLKITRPPSTKYIQYTKTVKVPVLCTHKPRDKLCWVYLVISVLLNVLFVYLLLKNR